MTILLINASIRAGESVSRALSYKLAKKLENENIIERDLANEITFVSSESLSAVRKAKENRSPEQAANKITQLADTLIEELQNADTVIIGAPVYNFGPPASLKAWADLVARAGTTFRYTENGPEGLLKDKKAYIVAVSGGTKIGSEIDFMSPWLRHFLGFIGITNVEMIIADGVFGMGGEEKVKGAYEYVESITA